MRNTLSNRYYHLRPLSRPLPLHRRDSLSPRCQHQRPRQKVVRLLLHGYAHIRTIAKITCIVRVTCLFRPRGFPREHNYRLLFCICTLSFPQHPHSVLFFLGIDISVDTYMIFLERGRELIAAQVVEKEMLLLLLIDIILVVWGCSVNMYIVSFFYIPIPLSQKP